MHDIALGPAFGALLGLIAGSFLATLVIRWPQGRRLNGRSKCDSCGVQLGVRDLVPLASWALARGRCRACGGRIDPRHPAMEAVGAAIGAASLAAAPGAEGFAGALFGWLLLALFMLDLEHLWLPDQLTGALAATGLLAGALELPPALLDRLVGGAAGFGALFLVAAAYRVVRGRVGLGGGDPKLFGAIGCWLGWRALPTTLLVAALAGLAWVAVQHLRGRNVSLLTRVPFGALLAPAAWLMWLLAAG